MLSRQHLWSKSVGVSEGRGVGRFGLCSEEPLEECTQRLDYMETEFCSAPSWPYLHCSPWVTPAVSDILTLQGGRRDLCGGAGGPATIAVPRPTSAMLGNWGCFPHRPLKMCFGKVEHLWHLLWWTQGFSRRLQCLQDFLTTQGHQKGDFRTEIIHPPYPWLVPQPLAMLCGL